MTVIERETNDPVGARYFEMSRERSATAWLGGRKVARLQAAAAENSPLGFDRSDCTGVDAGDG
jgi:hypothetical protein